MKELKDFYPKNIKRKQLLMASVIAGVLLGIVVIYFAIDSSIESSKIPFDIEQSKKKIVISRLAQGTKTEDRWLEQAEGDIKAVTKYIEQSQIEKQGLEAKVNELEKTIQAIEEEKKAKETDTSIYDEVLRLREELENLKLVQSYSLKNEDASKIGQLKKIRVTELQLDGEDGTVAKGKKYKLESYLPAGSYAPAVLVSGVDASVGVNSQGDPRPVLMRVTGQARSAANDSIIQKVDLVGCTVTGAASGDLSSERAFIRLVKMTCSREDETVYEAPLEGYVSAIGKAGVRGEVISREGDFVTKSFLAGIISGFGEGAAQKFTNPVALPSGLATQKPGMEDIVGSGVGKGVSNSSNRLSEYLIKRAEQYQPVISIPAGIDVELVFNEGVYIDGRSVK